MKKCAVTFIELLIAMSLISVIGILSISCLKIFIKDDTDLLKYKAVLGTVSEVVSRLNDDSTMYPTRNGFAYTGAGKYESDDKVYQGESKFRKLFKSKFNVLSDNIEFGPNTIGLVPAYKYKYFDREGKKQEQIKVVKFSELHCFTENKGITYCLPDTSEEGLLEIYVRTYLNAVDINNTSTFDDTRAIYFLITNVGKISVPPTVSANDKTLFDCLNMQYNDYAQCRVRERTTEVDITNKNKVNKR